MVEVAAASRRAAQSLNEWNWHVKYQVPYRPERPAWMLREFPVDSETAAAAAVANFGRQECAAVEVVSPGANGRAERQFFEQRERSRERRVVWMDP